VLLCGTILGLGIPAFMKKSLRHWSNTMPFIDLSKEFSAKPLPVLTTGDTPLRVKLSKWDPYYYPRRYSVILSQYFKLWKEQKREDINIVIINDNYMAGELTKISSAYGRYYQDSIPFVPILKVYYCDCGDTSLNDWGVCVNCMTNQSSDSTTLGVAMWMAKRGRYVIKTIQKPVTPIRKIKDIINLRWDDDSKLKVITKIIEESK
jgi:hypothetical protein